MPARRVVLDANILIRAVLGRRVRGLLEEHWGDVGFFAPDVCFADAEKYLPRLFEKRGLPAEPALDLLKRLSRLVVCVDEPLYAAFEADARARMEPRDPDDWPVVAAALALDCPVWTEDADFFGAGVPTWTSDRIHLYLRPRL